MRLPPRLPTLIVALLAALTLVTVINTVRIGRVHAVTAAGDESLRTDPHSPTGFANGLRQLIVANHDNDSYEWIAQTQQSITQGTWRVRQIAYDNAPFGRTVLTPSPYRWWLAFLGWCDQVVSGQPAAACVEVIAPYADPILFALLLFVSAIILMRSAGTFAASVFTLALAGAFPLGTWFIGGAPTDVGLALFAATWSVLALVIGLLQCAPAKAGDESARSTSAARQRWFLVGGVVAGVALWLNTAMELMFIGGITVGAVGLRLALRKRSSPAGAKADETNPAGIANLSLCWKWWSVAGAATTLLAFCAEYLPAYLASWRMEFVHPAYGIGWLGLGALLASLFAARSTVKVGKMRRIAGLVLAIATLAVPLVVIWRTGTVASFRAWVLLKPTHLAGALPSDTLWSWIARTGPAASLWAIVASVIVVGVAFWGLCRHTSSRAAVAFALGPALVLVAIASTQLLWWAAVDGAVLALLIACVSALEVSTPRRAWTWLVAVVLCSIPGAWLLRVEAGSAARADLSETDVIALVERDLSHWLANRVGPGGAIVLAPPSLTTSLFFHGGLRGLGTPYWDNQEGITATVRLAAASSPDEGMALARRRKVNYIVVPSWDQTLNALVRANSSDPSKTLLSLLQQMQAPRWLHPVPYPMPVIAGFEGRSVAVFEVVDVQDNATALSRLAMYFVETQRLEDAGAVAMTLERSFPDDLGGRVARATVALAYGDTERTAIEMKALVSPEALSGSPGLAWDQQVAYAIALAQTDHRDLARTVLQRCLDHMDEARLRFLNPQALYRLQVLCKVCRTDIPDARLRTLARDLLPPELREKV